MWQRAGEVRYCANITVPRGRRAHAHESQDSIAKLLIIADIKHRGDDHTRKAATAWEFFLADTTQTATLSLFTNDRQLDHGDHHERHVDPLTDPWVAQPGQGGLLGQFDPPGPLHDSRAP